MLFFGIFRILLETGRSLSVSSIPVRVTIMQSHRWLKIAVCGFSFFLKNEFVRYLYATHIFQRTSLTFLHSPLCIIMNIIHLAFITKNKLAVCYFIRCQRAYSYTIPHGIILILYSPSAAERQKLCPLLPIPLPVHFETYVSIHS